MISTKPYLIRAIHEWCIDSGLTPYLTVQVDERTQVPREFVRDGQIVLNVNTEATHLLVLGNDEISFQTRFNGSIFSVVVPVDTVVAIYARENGQGMAFEATEATATASADEKTGIGDTAVGTETTAESNSAPRRGAHLTRVK